MLSRVREKSFKVSLVGINNRGLTVACCSCVEKLAYGLMTNHKIDMIRAYELAEKGIERYESRKKQPQIVKIKSGNPTDYTQSCTKTGSPNCKAPGTACSGGNPCIIDIGTCACGCPSPLLNSHQVSNCSAVASFSCPCRAVILVCLAGSCTGCAGTCGYDCDVGYVWNGVACVSPVTVKKFFKLKPRGGDAKSKVWFRKSLKDSGVGG